MPRKKNDINLRIKCPKCDGPAAVRAISRNRRYFVCNECGHRFIGVTRRQLRRIGEPKKKRTGEDPYVEGWSARQAGRPSGANPYVRGCEAWGLWADGWVAGGEGTTESSLRGV